MTMNDTNATCPENADRATLDPISAETGYPLQKSKKLPETRRFQSNSIDNNLTHIERTG
jgi:hypothetical protein